MRPSPSQRLPASGKNKSQQSLSATEQEWNGFVNTLLGRGVQDAQEEPPQPWRGILGSRVRGLSKPIVLLMKKHDYSWESHSVWFANYPIKGHARSAMSEGSTHNILLLLSLNFACFYIDYRVFNSHAKPWLPCIHYSWAEEDKSYPRLPRLTLPAQWKMCSCAKLGHLELAKWVLCATFLPFHQNAKKVLQEAVTELRAGAEHLGWNKDVGF